MSESSSFANVLVGKVRQMKKGVLLPASRVMSHSHKHIVLGVMEAGKFKIWRKAMKTWEIYPLLVLMRMKVTADGKKHGRPAGSL